MYFSQPFNQNNNPDIGLGIVKECNNFNILVTLTLPVAYFEEFIIGNFCGVDDW